MKLNNENTSDNKENNSNEEKGNGPAMILTINVGNNQLRQLNIYDIDNTEKDVYDFCLKYKLDFNILKEIKNQIQILITNKLLENIKQNLMINSSKDESEINNISNNEKNIKYQNYINNSDNLTETNFITNQQNNIDDLNNLEIFDNKNINNNSNLKKYYNKVNNNNIANIKDNKKIIRHKIHKSKIEEIDKQIETVNYNNNIFSPPLFNNITPNNSSLFFSPTANSYNNNNNNQNLALRNYFSKEEDNYFPVNSPYFENNINIHNKNPKNNKTVNKSMNKSLSLSGIHLKTNNPGKDLYERNLKYNEEKIKKINILKKNLELDQDEDNTFSPKINKISKLQNERRKQKKLEYSNPDIIKNYKQYKDDKIKSLKQKQQKEYEKNYTFKPNINNTSSISKNIVDNNNNKVKKLGSKLDIKNISCLNYSNDNSNCSVKNKYPNKNSKNIIMEKNYNCASKSITRFERLYNERLYLKENKNKLRQKIYNEFSFKPKINEKSTYFKLDKPFKERLKTYSNKSRENMIKIRNIYEKEKGLEESFKPQINSKKNEEILKNKKEDINERQIYNNKYHHIITNINIINQYNKNKKNKKINNKKNNKSYSNFNIISCDNFKNEEKKMDCYTKLYLYDEKYKQEKNKMAEKYYKSQNKSPTFCNYSEEIINKKREKYFKKIFSLLDADEDNKITAEHINIFAIPKKLQKILEPIFISLEEENESLNDIEFIYVCKQLYDTLSWTDKREFMSFVEQEKNNYKKEKINDFKNIYTFKPNINKRNSSYEKLGITMTDGKNYHYIVEKENIDTDKSIKKNSNIRNNAENKNKSISSKNCIMLNSDNNKHKIKTNDDHIKNNNLKGNIDYSLIRGKNKNSLINNNIQNALIKSTNNTYKNNKLANYFNVMSRKIKNQKKS